MKKSLKLSSLLIAGTLATSISAQATTLTMALRLDASEFTTAGVISSWSDISGNGHNATATGDASVVINELNGSSVVRFDGNDYFTVSDTYATGSAFIVAKYNSASFNGFDGLYTGDGSAGTEIYFSGTNSDTKLWGETALDKRYLNGALTEQANPGAFNLYSGVDSTPQTLTGYNIGADRSSVFAAGRAWEGDIAEVIVYEEALSDFDRMGVEVYLDDKWGLGQDLSNTYGTGNYNTDLVALGVVAVPEPSSAALLGLGGLALILRRRK